MATLVGVERHILCVMCFPMSMARNRERCRSIAIAPVVVAAAVAMLWLAEGAGTCQRVPIVFNFGDSNSDTGGAVVGGWFPGLPSGRLHFGRATGRLCDGRLVIDFLCESIQANYLCPYLEAMGSNFTNGANFALGGATARASPELRFPFPLGIQTYQFGRFRARSLDLLKQGWKDVIDEEGFRDAVYAYDIGQNDLTVVMGSHMSYQQILQTIPSILNEIKASIESIYQKGGRNFWVHNTGPLGCLPEKLATYNKDGTDLDAAGCLTTFNNAAKAFNSGLDALCDDLRSRLQGATIVYNDVYSIKYDIISNYTRYGFDYALMACCGYGGPPYNFNSTVKCLGVGYNLCSETAKHVSWDGVHYSEAANAIVASKLLSTDYSKPRIKFESFCGA